MLLIASECTHLPFSVSLHDQYDSAIFITDLAYFDNDAVQVWSAEWLRL